MTQSARFENNSAEHTPLVKAFSQAEKFEILSAYLDDEATEQEQRWVQRWLSSDSHLQQAYQNQLKLRAAIGAILVSPKDAISPVPAAPLDRE